MVVKGSEGRHNRKRFYVASIISAVVFLTLIVSQSRLAVLGD